MAPSHKNKAVGWLLADTDAIDRLFTYCQKNNIRNAEGALMYKDILSVAIYKHIVDLEVLDASRP